MLHHNCSSSNAQLTSMQAAQMVRDIAQAYKGNARSNTTTPGLIDGQRIQVRGGARKDWKRYAADYVID